MANKMNSTKVVTGVVRLSYANVWEPVSINGSNPKYSVSLIIPKSDRRGKLRKNLKKRLFSACNGIFAVDNLRF